MAAWRSSSVGVRSSTKGNAKKLLDNVSNFPEHWTRDDGRHGAYGNAPRPAGSIHDSGLILFGRLLGEALDDGDSAKRPAVDEIFGLAVAVIILKIDGANDG